MKETDFNNKNEYLMYLKQTLYSSGLKCMILAIATLLLMMIFGINELKHVSMAIGFSESTFWIIPKIITVCFVIGSAGFLFSLTIKEELYED